ncbi:hypothetical protein [Legionella longbeachae]|uniref:hypothetical protein n=1 Tax=Legionella longbeachae TaxID=450 RepID=UPI0012479076|nr:hypothetical protein [Legionella longbeachae]QEY51412.1 hypothetical protein FQU71_09255 [Legionella longbeachae]
MGFSSEHAQERQQEQDLIDRLTEIEDSFDDETQDIVHLIKTEGFKALTKEQMEAYKNDIEPELMSRFVHCSGCSSLFDNKGIRNSDEDDDTYFCENCIER